MGTGPTGIMAVGAACTDRAGEDTWAPPHCKTGGCIREMSGSKTSDSSLFLSFFMWNLKNLSLGAKEYIFLHFIPYCIYDHYRLLYEVTEKQTLLKLHVESPSLSLDQVMA